jgi:cell division protein FtsB
MLKYYWKKYIWGQKYLIVLGFFILWVAFIDESSILEKRSMKKKISKLEKEKQYYLEQIQKDSVKLYQLKTNTENLEKFARENFYMKKDGEDIFIIEEKEN